MPPRASDRWITPAVVVTFLIVAGLLVFSTVAAVTFLSARGVDPDPMLRLVAEVGTAVSAIGSLGLQLAGRATVAKVERNTGLLARPAPFDATEPLYGAHRPHRTAPGPSRRI